MVCHVGLIFLSLFLLCCACVSSVPVTILNDFALCLLNSIENLVAEKNGEGYFFRALYQNATREDVLFIDLTDPE